MMSPTQLSHRAFTLLCVLTSLSLPSVSAEKGRTDNGKLVVNDFAKKWDWFSYSQLTPQQRAQISGSCTGLYIDPLVNSAQDAQTSLSIDQLPLIIEANTSVISGGTHATLEGDVLISQGQRSIEAQRMTYNSALDEAILEDSVTIRQPGMLVRGEFATASTIKNSAQFKDSNFVLHAPHIRGSAESIAQTGSGEIVLHNGSVTSCEPNSDAWILKGSELSIDQNIGQGYGKHVRLEIAGTPILYLPYISFPVGEGRQSGFLYPAIGNTNNGGFDLSVPYYWNIAPNYDATISPRIISGRGSMLETEFRHLSKTYSNELSLGYLPDDDGGNYINDNTDDTDTQDLPTSEGRDRWLIKYDQLRVANDNWSMKTNFIKVSDINYLRDLSTSSFSVNNTTYLDQSVRLGYHFDKWEINAQIQNYQVLLSDVDKPYRKLPEINVNGDLFLGELEALGRVSANLEHKYTYFENPDTIRLNGSHIVTGHRLATDYRAMNFIDNDWAYVNTEVGYKSLHYGLNDLSGNTQNLTKKSLHFGAAQASIDMGLSLEHPGGHLLQTLEPRIYYLYRQYDDQSDLYNIDSTGQSLNFDTSVRTFSYNQLYRDSRFSGYDRLDDANQVTVGLTSRWYEHHSGREVLSASIGQIAALKSRRVGLNNTLSANDDSSELAANISFPIGHFTDTYFDVIYDKSSLTLNRLTAGVNFASRNRERLFNILYSYVALNPEVNESERIEQIDANFIAPINQQWALFGRVNFDFENDQELESFLGFEYDDCCYRIRFLARRFLDSSIANLAPDGDPVFDNGVYFEVQLKGLGGSGAKVKSILEDSIVGYRDRYNSQNK